jgi:hypothetical protein
MNYLECPYCEKDAVRFWEFFFLSPFWLHRSCRHCNKKVHFDFNTIKLVVYSLLAAIVLCNIIDRVFLINLGIFGVGIVLLFVCLPFLLGKKLFLKEGK